jgi:hypothetical protein
MDGSSQEGEVKKQFTKVKTFPVPLRENQENITIATNTSSKQSKKQIKEVIHLFI